MTFEIKLPLFEGPFDLLLFFIERDELDIYDIPISKITNDFLDYLNQLEKLNIEVASEFILVAATLMRIKAKMLLPRPVVDAAGNEIDPRDELVNHLLEYKKYKSVIEEIAALEASRLGKEVRGNVIKELKTIAATSNLDAELQDLDLYKLLKVYMKVMARFEEEQNRPVHRIVPYPYTVEEQRGVIMQLIDTTRIVSFEEIISMNRSRVAVIFNFLAVLDLLQAQLIVLHEVKGFNQFHLVKKEPQEDGEQVIVSIE